MNKLALVSALLSALILSSTGVSPPQRFQAERFLDMLAKTFDPKVAYTDLLVSLHRRMNLDPPVLSSNSTFPTPEGVVPEAASGSPGALDTGVNCPDVSPIPGTVVTYTSDPHVRGSRAFYQCEPGFTGRSRFVQCQSGGLWSSTQGYTGCVPIDCGQPVPSVQHSAPVVRDTTFGASVTYTCEPGYQLSTPGANVTCLASGKWDTPTFTCDKVATVPQMNPASLSGMGSLFTASGPGGNAGTGNPMMDAIMKTMASLGNQGNNPQGSPPMMGNAGNNNMMANFAKMFPQMMPAPPPTTTTPAPPPPPQNNNNNNHNNNGAPNGFQLPSHLQSLLPNGMSNTQGINPNDLMALAGAGLGSNNPAMAPRGLNQLFGSMNPLQALMGGPGMGGLGGMSPGGPGGVGGHGMAPDPEKAAEQREEMMKRAMMANMMKSMMAPRGNQGGNNSTAAAKPQNSGMDFLALMALQNSLGGGGGGAGGGMGAAGMDPAMMMLGGMNLEGLSDPSMLGLGGGAPANMFGGGSGAGMFGNLGSLFGA